MVSTFLMCIYIFLGIFLCFVYVLRCVYISLHLACHSGSLEARNLLPERGPGLYDVWEYADEG